MARNQEDLLPSRMRRTKRPLPLGIADAPGVSYEGAVFIFGGYGEGPDDIKNCVLRYSTSDDLWSLMASMSKARWGAAATLYDTCVYVFSGAVGGRSFFSGKPRTTRVVERYDIAGDNWRTLRAIPVGLSAHGLMAVTVGSRIYLFSEAFTFEYDPVNDTYERRADAPVARKWGTCAHVKVGDEDRVYIIGGFDSKARGVTNANYYYLPNSDEWIGSEAMAPYRAMGMTRDNPVWENKIYFGFGHRKPDTFYRDIYAYDPEEDTWTRPLPKASFARDGVACAVVGNGLYVIGGRSEPDDALAFGLPYNERFELGADQDEES